MADIRSEYRPSAERRTGGRRFTRRCDLEQARANRLPLDWDAHEVSPPPKLGVTSFEGWDPAELASNIDWTLVLRTWKLKGTFPASSTTERRGTRGRCGRAGIARAVGQCESRRGFWAANSFDDDIAVYAGERRVRPVTPLRTLRQQLARDEAHPNLSLAGFLAPGENGVNYCAGAFALTTGNG